MSGAAVDVPTDPRMGVTLRAFVTVVANDLGVPAEQVEDLALAVSELLASAVEGGSKRLRIAFSGASSKAGHPSLIRVSRPA